MTHDGLRPGRPLNELEPVQPDRLGPEPQGRRRRRRRPDPTEAIANAAPAAVSAARHKAAGWESERHPAPVVAPLRQLTAAPGCLRQQQGRAVELELGQGAPLAKRDCPYQYLKPNFERLKDTSQPSNGSWQSAAEHKSTDACCNYHSCQPGAIYCGGPQSLEHKQWKQRSQKRHIWPNNSQEQPRVYQRNGLDCCSPFQSQLLEAAEQPK